MSYSLYHIPTRQEAYEILSKMKVAELVDVAKIYKVHIPRKNKKEIIERVINSTVGVRLKKEAIRDLEL